MAENVRVSLSGVSRRALWRLCLDCRGLDCNFVAGLDSCSRFFPSTPDLGPGFRFFPSIPDLGCYSGLPRPLAGNVLGSLGAVFRPVLSGLCCGCLYLDFDFGVGLDSCFHFFHSMSDLYSCFHFFPSIPDLDFYSGLPHPLAGNVLGSL